MSLSVHVYVRGSAAPVVNGSPHKSFAIATSNFAGAFTTNRMLCNILREPKVKVKGRNM